MDLAALLHCMQRNPSITIDLTHSSEGLYGQLQNDKASLGTFIVIVSFVQRSELISQFCTKLTEGWSSVYKADSIN